MNFQYSKANRLLTKTDFAYLKQGSHKIRDPFFICYYKPSPTSSTRLGLSISSQNLNSVQRNRLKRILRDKFRHQKKWLTSLDILIVVKASKPVETFSDYEKNIACSFSKLLINLSALTC